MRLITLVCIFPLLSLFGCGTKTPILSKAPIITPLSQDSHAARYIQEFGHSDVSYDNPIGGWTSPDGRWKIFVKQENSEEELAGFYSVRLIENNSGVDRVIFTLWDADVGSGSNVGAKWSRDGKAINLRGGTRGFQYSKLKDTEFDFIYIIGEDRLFQTQ